MPTLSIRRAIIVLALPLALAGCESGSTAQGGLPGLLDRVVTGAPQRVTPGVAPPGSPAARPEGVPQANIPPANIPTGAPPPRPALPSNAIETESLPGLRLTPPTGADVIRIGFLAPLSGPSAPLGRALFEAAQLALFDLNDDHLALLPRDTAGTPEQTATATRELLASGAQIIIGPLFSADTAAAAPLARERDVRVLSFSTDRSVAGGGTYLLGFMPEQQVARAIGFARSRGMSRFALLAPDTPYGDAIAAATESAVAQSGGRLMKAERYPSDSSADLTPIARRFAAGLRALPPRGPDETMAAGIDPALSRPVDALLIPEGGSRLRALAPLLPFFDIDPRAVKFIGTGLWDDASLGSEPALLGGWYAGPAQDGFEAFRKRFEQAFSHRPPRLASLAYDATALVGILAQRGGAAAFSDAVLTSPDGFAGYDGIFRFRADGTVERGLAILEVQRRGSRVIDPAPASFLPAAGAAAAGQPAPATN
ncbi:penicillin-binding protein activator [Ferrovibrio xuzhouensis]|uniref:ABC transporter substrate-binding protein n=1 Tax=Ferrovibrio xuzhouensis TaxID=1576914 RepID=A0ABV7VF29_9PROT